MKFDLHFVHTWKDHSLLNDQKSIANFEFLGFTLSIIQKRPDTIKALVSDDVGKVLWPQFKKASNIMRYLFTQFFYIIFTSMSLVEMAQRRPLS